MSRSVARPYDVIAGYLAVGYRPLNRLREGIRG
jgi:hypothetical protein